ncbi:uncharacterized protein LOC129941367 [Eupeodes corollae]|uniref:uncharacterized protein LOC129941367 n=1 Tax=Eupeodes corollae TaxID=290404 RepID=UPI0024907C02|nr:uncharacterized protein LOC129941367 [Eupeodes corollae]
MLNCRAFDCPDSNTRTSLILTKNKLLVELSQDDTEETISNYIKNGIINFGLDLFFGSVQQNLKIIAFLKKASLRESELLGFSIPLSIYVKLSPRLQYTGRFKRNKTALHLKVHRKVTLTTNRDYASASCHSIIYVNAKFLIGDVRKCDIICLGRYVQLQVLEVQSQLLICNVIVAGVVRPQMPVRFPKYIEEAHSKISAEELEDIGLAMGTNINVIVSFTPGNDKYCAELRDTLAEFKCNHFYLFTRLNLSCLESSEDAHRISDEYDGFLIDYSNTVCTDDKIVKLSPLAREFMENSYRKKKPIFLLGCWSNLIDPSDYRCAFQYPDKYVLPCDLKFLHLFEAIFHNLSKTDLLGNQQNMNLGSNNAFARSIAAASWDFQAEAIIVCSTVGEMAIRISHFRPKSVIVATTSLNSALNYSSMHHNICMLSFNYKDNNDSLVSHKEENHQKLIHGLRYALFKKHVNSSDTVILVYRQHFHYGSTDKFVVVNIDDDYEEAIRNVIFN